MVRVTLPRIPSRSWGCGSWVESWRCCSLLRHRSTFCLVDFGFLRCVVKTRLVPNLLLTSVVLGGARETDGGFCLRALSCLALSAGLRVDVI